MRRVSKYNLGGCALAQSLRRNIVVIFNIFMALLSYYLYTITIEMRTEMSSWYLDAIPNFLAVYITCGFLALVFRKMTGKDTLAITFGVCVYEVMQLWIPDRTFDVKDIIASLVAGLLLYAINKWLNDNIARKELLKAKLHL